MLTPDRPTRFLIQNVQSDDAGRVLQAELDGQLFHELTTELPDDRRDRGLGRSSTPRRWTHNKHVHLIQFQVIERTPFDAARYLADWKRGEREPAVRSPDVEARSRRPTSPGRRRHRARGERLEGHDASRRPAT